MKTLFSLVLVVCACTAFAGYKIGDEPGDFKLKNVDSSMVTLESFVTNRGVMLVFMSNNCPTSLFYEDRILDLARKLGTVGWKTIAINSCSVNDGPDETFDGNVKRAEERTYEFPYLFDETQAVAKAFGIAYMPTVVLLRSTGSTFEVSYMGAIDDAPEAGKKLRNKFVENAMAALNASAKPDTPMSKVTGCAIKWKH